MNGKTEANLASRANACWVVTSSNANFDSLYSDNVNDDDPNTAWRSFQKTTEEWADLAWDFEMSLNRVRIVPHELPKCMLSR